MQTSIDARAGELMTIPLSLLVPSPKKNVRRTGGENVSDLKASIEAQGLLQNLIVCPAEPTRKKGQKSNKGIQVPCEEVQLYEVVGGGRRLRALLALAKEGKISKDEEILCRVKPTRAAAEASLAENFHREPMHPADEFEAFHRLVEEGNTVEEVAERFGTSPLTVRRRLKLADVHPDLRQLYRDDGINMEQLMALALSDDPEEQLSVWNSTPSWCRDAHSLRSRLVSDEVDASSDALAKFVGLDAYEAAGGTVRRDLFSEQGQGYVQHTALLNSLASDKLEVRAVEVRAEGWSWVDVVLRASTVDLYKFGRARKTQRAMTRKEAKERKALERQSAALVEQMDALQDGDHSDADQGDEPIDGEAYERLDLECDEVNAKLREMEEGLSSYDAEAMAHAGAIVCVNRDGTIQIHRGLISAKDRRAAEGGEDGAGDEAGEEGGAAAKRKVKPTHSAALMQELTAQKTLAARAAMLDRPDVALTALLHCLLQRLMREVYAPTRCAVRLVTSAPDEGLYGKAGSTLAETRAAGVLAEARERWGDRIPGEADKVLPWLQGLADSERMDLLALCVALSLNDVHGDEKPGAIDPLCTMLGLDMADWWEAGQRSYFARVTKDVILNAIAEGAGAEAAARCKGVSKGELARVAERDLAGRRWLPAPLKAVAEPVTEHQAA